MENLRLMARLDIKGANLIKGICFEGLRVIGDPGSHAREYYRQGADELVYIDSVASLYGRNSLAGIVRDAAVDVFVPLTVGGGIRSVADARLLLRSGADKVAINTAAVHRPELLSDVADGFGSQCVVLSVQAKQVAPGRWEVYTDCGRERTHRDVVEWVQRGVRMGAGEVLVTSVDRDGTFTGFDTALLRAVCAAVHVPVTASGGMGRVADLDALAGIPLSGIAMGAGLHRRRFTLPQVRDRARSLGMGVREHAA